MNFIKPVYAAITNPVLKNADTIAGTDNGKSYFNSILQTLINLLILFGVLYFVVHFLFSGFHMISSQGDPKKYEEAIHGLLHSLMGLAVIFSVFALLKLLGMIFGITGLEELKISWPSI